MYAKTIPIVIFRQKSEKKSGFYIKILIFDYDVYF